MVEDGAQIPNWAVWLSAIGWLLGCQGSLPHPPQPAAQTQPTAAPTNAVSQPEETPQLQSRKQTRLLFELNGEPFPSPIVDATIGGYPTRMMIDTGTTHHVIASWVVDELALPTVQSGDVAMDHAGQSIQVSRLEQVEVRLSGWGRVTESALVIRIPEILQRAGIGGIVSPQALVSANHQVMIDFKKRIMEEIPSNTALEALTPNRQLASNTSNMRRCGDQNEGSELIVSVMIESVSGTMKVDSGATQSSLFAQSGLGKQFSKHPTGTRSAYAASGKHTVPFLEEMRIRVEGFETRIDLDLLPNAPRKTCTTDGFMGMDVLKSCTLVIGERDGRLVCGTEP